MDRCLRFPLTSSGLDSVLLSALVTLYLYETTLNGIDPDSGNNFAWGRTIVALSLSNIFDARNFVVSR